MKVLDAVGRVFQNVEGYTSGGGLDVNGSRTLYACWITGASEVFMLTDRIIPGADYLIADSNAGSAVIFGENNGNIPVSVTAAPQASYAASSGIASADVTAEIDSVQYASNVWHSDRRGALKNNATGDYLTYSSRTGLLYTSDYASAAKSNEYSASGRSISGFGPEGEKMYVRYRAPEGFTALTDAGEGNNVFIYRRTTLFAGYSFGTGYTVTYRNDDGSLISVKTVDAAGTSVNVTLDAPPTRADEVIDGKTCKYIFEGWEQNGILYAQGATCNITGNTVFTAKWGKYVETTVYKRTSSFVNGGEYVIAASDGYAIELENGAYRNGRINIASSVNQQDSGIYYYNGTAMSVMDSAYISEDSAADVLKWQAANNGTTVPIKSGSYYLTYSNNKGFSGTKRSSSVTYQSNKMTCGKGTVRSANGDSVIYIYEKTVVYVKEELAGTLEYSVQSGSGQNSQMAENTGTDTDYDGFSQAVPGEDFYDIPEADPITMP